MNPVVIDFETVIIKEDGTQEASTEAYLPNFRVTSMSISERGLRGEMLSEYFIGEDAIRICLLALQFDGRLIVAHNLQFELLVTKCRFPDIQLNWHADTMRLVQNYDNGGRDDAFETVVVEDDGELDGSEDLSEALSKVSGEAHKKVPISGLGLVKCLKRLMPNDYVDHKKEAYDWLSENVPEAKKGKLGKYLHMLPDDIMRRYNIADTENTLKLYEFCTKFFRSIDYDWTFDNQLFMSTVRMVVDAKIRGVRVDREKLIVYAQQVEKEIQDIGAAFRARFIKEIEQVEQARLDSWCDEPKTEKGKANRRKKCIFGSDIWNDHVRFNVGSNSQLADLFVDVMKIEPKFFTLKGQPSFKSAMLSAWGEGGEMLKKRRKRMLVLKQSESLIGLSEQDGRWHLSLKVASTASGRLAGGNH